MGDLQDNDNPDRIEIYTDGSCLGNPGKGGWAFLVIDPYQEFSGGEQDTTNNRMELTATIQALSAYVNPVSLKINSDSRYVIDGIERYCYNWVNNGWKSSTGKPVKNQDLWMTLYELNQKHDVVWHWVKAHAKSKHNNRADELARESALNIRIP